MKKSITRLSLASHAPVIPLLHTEASLEASTRDRAAQSTQKSSPSEQEAVLFDGPPTSCEKLSTTGTVVQGAALSSSHSSLPSSRSHSTTSLSTGPALKHRSSSFLPRSAAARVEIAEVLRSYQASIGEIFCDLRTSMETINSTTASAATTFHDVAKETGKTLQSFNKTTALSLEAVDKLAREHWDAEVPAAERRAQGRGQSHHQPSSPSATQGHLKFSAPSPSSSELQPNMKRRRVQFEDLDYCTRDTPVTSSMDEPPRPQKRRRSIRWSFSFPADTSRNSIQTTLAAVTSESRGKIEQEEAIFEAHDELDHPMSGEAIHEELDRHMVDNEMQDVDMSSHGTQEIQESRIDEMDHTLHQLSLQRNHQQITDGFRMARLTIAQERPRVRDLVRVLEEAHRRQQQQQQQQQFSPQKHMQHDQGDLHEQEQEHHGEGALAGSPMPHVPSITASLSPSSSSPSLSPLRDSRGRFISRGEHKLKHKSHQ